MQEHSRYQRPGGRSGRVPGVPFGMIDSSLPTSSFVAERSMPDGEDDALQERLKAALWFSIGKIVDEETLKLGVNATPQFIGALTEMVWAQIENVSQDLESFSKHAGRNTISVEDVMLLARRNEGLEAVLRNFVDKQGMGKSKPTKKR